MIRIYATDGWNVAEDTIGFQIKQKNNINMLILRILEKYPFLQYLIKHANY